MNMLNQELINPVEALMGKMKVRMQALEKQINAFKDYDNNRKKYYSKIVRRVGELESYVQELESEKGIDKLRTQNEELKKQIKALEAKLYLAHNCPALTVEDDAVVLASQVVQYKAMIAAKNKKISTLEHNISDLVYKLANG